MTAIADMTKEPGATSFGFSYEQGASMIAEAAATLDDRKRAWSDLVDKGRLDPREAARRTALSEEILADLHRAFHPQPWNLPHGMNPPANASFHWRDKIAELRCEINDRNTKWPDLVEKGRMDDRDARRRIKIHQAIHDAYWLHGMAWQPSTEAGARYMAQIIDRGPRDWQDGECFYAELNEHLDAIVAQGRQEQQKLL